MRYRYDINISLMFILGAVFTIWGLCLCKSGIENRTNLKHIQDETVDIMKLKEGEYVTVDEMQLLGHMSEGIYFPISYVFVSPDETTYYLVNLNPDTNDYIGLEYDLKFREYEDYITSTGKWNNRVLKDGEISKEPFTFAAKVVKINEYHLDNIKSAKVNENVTVENWQANEKLALMMVDMEKEHRVLIEGICVLIAGLIFVLGSKPWKIVQKQELFYKQEYNLIYKDKPEVDERDLRFLQELAKDLRAEVQCYENRYLMLKKDVKKSAVAFGISLVVAWWIQILGALWLLCILYLIKFLFSLLKLKLNEDSTFASNCLSAISREPIEKILNDRKAKLEKCDNIIKESFARSLEKR